MILLSHPTGNAFVRALLEAFERAALEYVFHTSLVFDTSRWWSQRLPSGLLKELERRSFKAPTSRCHEHPAREIGRLLFSKLGLAWLVKHEAGWFSVDAVYRHLDRRVARALERGFHPRSVHAVYAYEDGACETFHAARALGLRCCYELPIAYWETSQRLLREEALRWPEWEPTLLATQDSCAKQERKSQELKLADVVICPSEFVYRSLPEDVRRSKACAVAAFGSPEVPASFSPGQENHHRPLRVVFAGTMTQRKGLADVFAAMRMLNRSDVKLVIVGKPLLPLEFYRRQFSDFTYEPPRPHPEVLELMRQCDVLVLPSIVEGRALVQQEAMSCGLPLIVTPNTGGEDLIEPGQTGFVVPIRSPEQIAGKLAWYADHRALLPAMREQARHKAAQFTWRRYTDQVCQAILPDNARRTTMGQRLSSAA